MRIIRFRQQHVANKSVKEQGKVQAKMAMAQSAWAEIAERQDKLARPRGESRRRSPSRNRGHASNSAFGKGLRGPDMAASPRWAMEDCRCL